jgi:predicted nucleic acid-binding protein
MRVFVDTSAFLAILDADDKSHIRAKEVWTDLITQDAWLICTNYVLVETFALVQHRLGMQAIRAFQEDVLPVVGIEWVDEECHRAGVSALLTAGRRQLSLVDCISFETMRQLGLNKAFAFDHHFEEQGFHVIP